MQEHTYDRQSLKVLVIEDDEDDFKLVEDLLSGISDSAFTLEWVSTYPDALEEFERQRHDVYLLDYRLGNRTGLELLQEANRNCVRAPVILLTGHGDYEVDMEAMKSGAADYLVKREITAGLLERSIRYALERKRSEEALRASEGQLKFLSSQLLTLQETERKRLAAELHDNLGQVLSAIKYRVESILAKTGKNHNDYEALASLVPLTRDAIEEVRRIYTNLRPTILDDFGVVATINCLCREFRRHHPGVQIDEEIDIEEKEVPDSLKIIIFRIVQEALSNIARHSKAELANLSLRRKEGFVELAIEDNGEGFPLSSNPSKEIYRKGLGLTSMKERTELSGGSFTLESCQGVGTTIRASWRLTDEKAN